MQNHPAANGDIVSQTEHRVSTRRADTRHETREQPIERIRAINNAVGKPDPRDGIPARSSFADVRRADELLAGR